jgi:uncharacterized protein (TIGR02271 family)
VTKDQSDRQDWQTAGAGASDTRARARSAEGEEALQLREERLRAQTQPVESGEVVLGKDVVTEQQRMDVPVRREEVDVEYRPTSPRPASGDLSEEEIRVPVREEQVRAEKETVVTGEVNVRKREVEDVEQITDEVRREVPRVERKGNADVNIQGASIRRQTKVCKQSNDERRSSGKGAGYAPFAICEAPSPSS